MKKNTQFFAFLTLSLLAASSFVTAQVQRGTVIVPSSSVAKKGDAGKFAHTNYVIYSPDGVHITSPLPAGETPASMGCVYKLVTNQVAGCPIAGTTENPTGGGGLIVLVDAFDYPTAANDLKHFATQFGMPTPKFKRMAASGKPTNDCNWSIEASLDIQWAFAMAPKAQIILMEAKTNSLNDLMVAVDKANQLITAHGGKGEISMSWQSSEFSGETSLDSHFTTPGVVYFASSGDTGGVNGWPGVSPNVVSAGGTRINRSGNTYNETGWSGSGGGPSAFELRPSYQDGIQGIVGTKRGVPDFAYDADPISGASVYNTNPSCGNIQWLKVGGTSLSSPGLAGIVNSTGSFSASTNVENTLIYSGLGNASIFTDITSGNAGGFSAKPGWDFVTGVGTDVGKTGK